MNILADSVVKKRAEETYYKCIPVSEFLVKPKPSLGDSSNAPVEIGPKDVCMWWVSLDQIASKLDGIAGLLSDDERKRGGRFIKKRDQERYAAGRSILRIILSQYIGLNPDDVVFRYGHNGKPSVDADNLSFNMSKSFGQAIYVLTRDKRIGVDIEKIREIDCLEQIAKQFFSKPEYELLCRCRGIIRTKMFLKFWARKEALVKAVGDGLSFPLNEFDVSANPDEKIRLVGIEEGLCGSQWTVMDLENNRGLAASLALEGSPAPRIWMHEIASDS